MILRRWMGVLLALLPAVIHGNASQISLAFECLIANATANDCDSAGPISLYSAGLKDSITNLPEYCDAIASGRVASRVEQLPSRPSYHEVFEEFISKARPFVGSCSGCSASVANAEQKHPAAIPFTLANNYLRHLRSVAKDLLTPAVLVANHSESATVTAAADGGGDVFSCSFGLNLVIWPADDADSIDVSLHDNRASQAWQIVAKGASSLGAQLRDLTRTPLSALDEGCLTPSSRARSPKATLHQNQFLFVPHMFGVNLLSRSGKAASVYASCSLDASNFHLVTGNLLRIAGQLDTESRQIAEELVSVGFDRSMSRSPTDLKWEEYLSDAVVDRPSPSSEAVEESTPAEGARKSRKKRRGSEYKSWQDQVAWDTLVAAQTVPRSHAPDSVRMDRYGAEVTLRERIELWSTAEGKASKSGFWLRWCAAGEDEVLVQEFALSRDGSATFLSNRWLGEHCAEKEYLSSELRFVDLGNVVSLSFEVANLSPNTFYQFQVARFHDSARSPYSEWTKRNRTRPVSVPAAPSELPRVEMISPFEVQVRMPSGQPSKPFELRAAKLSSCSVEVAVPVDDGGLPIERWEVFGKIIGECSNPHWSLLFSNSTPATTNEDGIVAFEARNLIPSATYSFKIRACNKIGCSNFSPSSLSDSQTGKQSAATENTSRERCANGLSLILAHWQHNNDIRNLDASSFLLMLDSASQQLVAFGPPGMESAMTMYEVWRGHWGCQCSLVLGSPAFLLDTAIESMPNLEGKIAFLRRNGQSLARIALTAQEAGASAVVIVDDGRCTQFDQRCLPGATRELGEGFAAEDIASYWKSLYIPVSFMLKDAAEALMHHSDHPISPPSPLRDEL